MKKTTVLLIMGVFSASANAGIIFSDDFESGNLDLWTIGGRQQGTNVAEVVSREGSLMGHLHHEDFTEINMEKTFDYDPSLAFSFDMAVNVSSDASSTSTHYAMGGAYFTFWDNSQEIVGYVY